ncbi:hypothetical protein MPH47_12150 [Psychrobacillus psychrodurans]|uniref:hypothetical protein n=1 Tax=Psychrobacillus psychrodurans TaxID=126157 RepID=UPI001F4E2518|nr:hypothetical protein [Psychrobacillus psychrodurans]MCK1997967.1 hypothetical protein [Psychrobacillus psychrodurans]
MKRLQQEAMREEMVQVNKTGMDGGIKMSIPKWAGVKYTVKSQTQQSFETEEELQKFLKANPQYEINQRFGINTRYINVEFYERGYAVMGPGFNGRLAPQRWLEPEEVEEYLKDPTA